MTTPPIITLQPGEMSFTDLRRVWLAPAPVALSGDCAAAIEAPAATVQAIVTKGDPAYGINTGFGLLVKTQIPTRELGCLQCNLILSYAVGTSEDLSDNVARLVLLMKAASLARRYSGVRRVVIDTLLALSNAGIVPCILSKGSVDTSGDLAPPAYMTLVLLGEGDVRANGVRTPACVAQAAVGIEPIALVAKEGLAPTNGTRVSTASALNDLFLTERLLQVATVSGALPVDVAKGSDAPFDPRVHTVCGQAGQIATAVVYRNLLVGSAIHRSHFVSDKRVQGPCSPRCQPQVMGARFDLIRQAGVTLPTEASAVTDNLPVYADASEVISDGNFHVELVAFAVDILALAIAEISAPSERHIALLTDSTLSGLPPFPVKQPGLDSDFMIAYITAAALASENKTFAHPVSVNSLPVSANQEDHVSMTTLTSHRLQDMAENTATIVGIEALVAVQDIDFHKSLATPDTLQKVHDYIRARAAYHGEDRLFAPDIEAARRLVPDSDLGDSCRAHVGELTFV